MHSIIFIEMSDEYKIGFETDVWPTQSLEM